MFHRHEFWFSTPVQACMIKSCAFKVCWVDGDGVTLDKACRKEGRSIRINRKLTKDILEMMGKRKEMFF